MTIASESDLQQQASAHELALTSALIEANDHLTALYRLTSVAIQSLEEHESVVEILRVGSQLVDADLALWLLEKDSDERVLHTEVAKFSSDDVKENRQQRISIDISSSKGGFRCTLSAYRDSLVFGTAEQKLLTAIGNVAMGAIEMARLHAAEISQAIMERDHHTASELAGLALPRWRPQVPGVSVEAKTVPVLASGGDLYCFDVVDDVLYLAMGDVSGKGLRAALMMTNVISAATAAFRSKGSTGEIMQEIDSWVYDYLNEASMFVSLVVMAYKAGSGHLQITNAGHSPVIVNVGGKLDYLLPTIPPIGVVPVAINESSYSVDNGLRVLIASDGFTDQPRPDGERFGDSALFDALATPDPVAVIHKQLFDQVEDWAAGEPQFDDRTLVMVDFGPVDSEASK